MNPEPRLNPFPLRTRIVTTLGRTFFTTPASESGARCVSGPAPGPEPPSTRGATPLRLAETHPPAPPPAPPSSAAPADRRAGRPGRFTMANANPARAVPVRAAVQGLSSSVAAPRAAANRPPMRRPARRCAIAAVAPQQARDFVDGYVVEDSIL